MAQRLYDTLTQKKVDFTPSEPGHVRMYVCGPTVYDMSHAGHARCYCAFDTIVRWLRATGQKVTLVRNYTDVDDKIIKRANELGVPSIELSERFIAEFKTDMAALSVRPADVEPKVTDHLPEIIAIIEKLVGNGHAYPAEGDVYFSVRGFPDYGKLSKRNLDDLLSGARVDPGEKKRDPLDFALWKAAKPGEPSWASPWGQGRPGWHIECSAMSAKYLGETFDLHGGGKDLVFPHHENEIAQSEAASGCTFARHWLHNGFITIDAEKMSKSLGNFFTIRDLLGRYDGDAVRLFLLGTHYRSPIDFSTDAIDQAETRVTYVYETLSKMNERLAREPSPPPAVSMLHAALLDRVEAGFREAFEDDFNTAQATGAIAELFPILNELAGPAKGLDKASVVRTLLRARALVQHFSAVLGVFERAPDAWLLAQRGRLATHRGIDEGWVEGQLVARTEARKAKDFAASDRIRDELKGRGVEIMDGAAGSSWRIVSER